MRRREFLLGLGVTAVVGTASAAPKGSPIVRIRSGLIRGVNHDRINAFTGIPYAEAPAGPLRFKAARPVKPWNGVLDTVSPARTPPQPTDPSLPPVTPLSEDCLQLNVWAPDHGGPAPVFVWIYGGGNSTGSCNQPAYQGDTFARDGVVFVGINYRVGVLGFLELGAITGAADLGSGNNAIRDQVLALQWVKDNIAAFGGDSAKITIGGQSAGAWNCSTLLAAPAAQGLFQQAIIASGGADAAYTPERAGQFAQVFVDHLGGSQRLGDASIPEILKAQQQAEASFEDFLPYRPVIDGTFLPARPIDLLRSSGAKNIATLIGHTRDEYHTFLSSARAEGPVSQKWFLHLKLADLPPIERAYESAFPALRRGDRMLRILGDELLGMPTLQTADAQAAAGARVFYYRMDYSIEQGPFGPYSAHGIDVPLFFDRVDTAFARQVFGYRDADRPMARRVHAAWVSFIKSGRIDHGLTGWAAYGAPTRQTLLIDNTPSLVKDPEHVERGIWANAMQPSP